MDPRIALTRALVRLVLVAALASAPIFLLAEELAPEHVLRVASSNGACALLCLLLLALLRRGRVVLGAHLFVLGLFALVGILAWSNGEDVHVNVVNFVLVTILASALLSRAALLIVGAAAAVEMVAIAWKQAGALPGEDLGAARLESIAQFLPTFAVVVLVLWLRERAQAARSVEPRMGHPSGVPGRG